MDAISFAFSIEDIIQWQRQHKCQGIVKPFAKKHDLYAYDPVRHEDVSWRYVHMHCMPGFRLQNGTFRPLDAASRTFKQLFEAEPTSLAVLHAWEVFGQRAFGSEDCKRYYEAQLCCIQQHQSDVNHRYQPKWIASQAASNVIAQSGSGLMTKAQATALFAVEVGDRVMVEHAGSTISSVVHPDRRHMPENSLQSGQWIKLCADTVVEKYNRKLGELGEEITRD